MRDSNIQQGKNNKMKVDNRASNSDGWIKSVSIAVIAGIILMAIGYAVNRKDTETNPKPSHQSATTTVTASVSAVSSTPTDVKQELVSTNSIPNGRVISIDRANPSNVFIATQKGLLLLKNDRELYRVGNNQQDIMAFAAHPTNPQVLFSSGRSETGERTGFQKSEDGGFTWKKMSDGAHGPVAFRTITVSPSNPSIIYGWFEGNVQRSNDGGSTWTIVSKTPFSAVSLAADTQNEKRVYAASPQGLFVSNDGGKSWNRLITGATSLVSIDSRHNNNLYSYSETYSLADSSNAGQTWNRTSANFNGETPINLGYYQSAQQDIVYILTEKNSIYKSGNGGGGWTKIR